MVVRAQNQKFKSRTLHLIPRKDFMRSYLVTFATAKIPVCVDKDDGLFQLRRRYIKEYFIAYVPKIVSFSKACIIS
ncbi:uncharacterized protein PHALS_15182 [Plasmopara halstedii]|uniref:Uncharacterized protein n=1 Tax=Plasmopara halstedii TaxID=4781 RepID=A0A0P1B4N7_PLAHL|nr:uncharacterized protein PHALS_15182 [Plasmopara halstedii]CEG48918.1 hypothetical protein PHALS_15182 [Plasmopara halstedii]|eukprot:XP_024585287.1 hypothetical protein PHALS_15182 [Plasmopara halstedii]